MLPCRPHQNSFKPELIELVLDSWTLRTEEWNYVYILQFGDRKEKVLCSKASYGLTVQYIVLYQDILKNQPNRVEIAYEYNAGLWYFRPVIYWAFADVVLFHRTAYSGI